MQWTRLLLWNMTGIRRHRLRALFMGSNEGNTREQPVRTGKPLGQDVSTRYVLRVGVWMPCKWAVIPNFKTGGTAERISVPEYNICIPGLFCASKWAKASARQMRGKCFLMKNQARSVFHKKTFSTEGSCGTQLPWRTPHHPVNTFTGCLENRLDPFCQGTYIICSAK